MKRLYTICSLFIIIILLCVSLLFINNKQTVAIIGAMDVEIEAILKNLNHKKLYQNSDFKIITGSFGKYKIVLSKSGVGKVNSATTTQFIIDKYNPKYIINTGIAGSLSSEIKAGETVIADKMVQHDFDITAFGTSKGYMNNGMDPNKPTMYYSDKVLVDSFMKKSKKKLKVGTIATGDVFVTNKILKENIRKEFNAIAIDMESASIAQTTKRNNVPVIVLRTISDGIDDSENEYKKNKHNTANQSALMLLEILESGIGD